MLLCLLFSQALPFLESCVAPASAPPALPDGYQLVQLQLITRHGSRSPLKSLLSDASLRGTWHCDADDAVSGRISVSNLKSPRRFRHLLDSRQAPYRPSCNLGELTIEGMLQHKQLGAAYRKYLIDDAKLLSSDYINPSELLVRATSYDRTYRSALSFLNGLYPPARMDELVDVVVGDTVDVLRPHKKFCNEIKELEEAYVESDKFKAYLNQSQQLYGALGKYLGVDIVDKSTMDTVCDWVNTQSCFEGEIGPDVTQEMIDKCKVMGGKIIYDVYFQSEENRTVAFSYGMREIFRLIDDNIAGVERNKFVLHSAHDSTVVAALVALGQKVDVIPPYASHLAIEILSKEQRYYIRFSFNGTPITIPMMNSTETIYEMHEFRTVMEPLVNDHCKDAI